MTKSARWAWIVSLVAITGAALVLAFVLSFSSAGTGFYERHFVWLFWVNVAVAALLVLVILLAALRLAVRVRRGKFGSRLLIKLAGIFAVVGLLPGLVIYTVSYQFVSRSIEAWFDVKVAGALDAGLSLGKTTLDALVADIGTKTRVAAERLAEQRSTITPLTLERLREQIGARDVALLGHNGQVLFTAGGGTAAVAPERPGLLLLRQARLSGMASQVDGLDEESIAAANAGESGKGPRVRALARIPSTDIRLAPADDRFLMVVQPISRALAMNALAVQAAYSEYQQRALARDSLRRMYIGTLTLALILAVFGSVLLAILLGNQLARPLLLLADGVRQVAAGDLQPKPVFASADELGGLTRSFAQMTAQLADAREQVERGVAQLEGARTRLQTILDTLTAGVIVFDREGRIDTVNPGATRILRLPLSRLARPPPGRAARAGDLRQERRPALRAAGHQPRGRRARPVAGRLRAGPRRRQHADAAGARRAAAGRPAADGLRRHHRGRLGAAQPGLGRGGAAAGARDQEPADADPAVGRTPAAPAGEQARRQRPEPADPQRGHHRQPGAGDADAGQRVPRLRPAAGSADEAAGPERAGGRGAGPVRPRPRPRRAHGAAGRAAATHPGRRDAAAPGDPQPGAERAGRGRRPGRRPRRAAAPRWRAANTASCARCA